MKDIWTNLPEGRGTLLSCYDAYTAAAELNRVTVWRRETRWAVIESKTQTPCHPRFAEGRMFWGDSILDLQTGTRQTVPGIAEALIEGTGLPAGPSPAGAYVPAVFAWSARTDCLVVGANWAGLPGPVMGRVVLVDENGKFKQALSEKNDAAPTAVWAGKQQIAVGWRQIEICGYDGCAIGRIDARTPPARLESNLDENKLLVVEYGRLSIVDIGSRAIIGSKAGNYLDASIDPQGQFVMALTLNGSVQILAIERNMPIQKTYDHPDVIRGLYAGCTHVAAAFSSGNPVRIALRQDILR